MSGFLVALVLFGFLPQFGPFDKVDPDSNAAPGGVYYQRSLHVGEHDK